MFILKEGQTMITGKSTIPSVRFIYFVLFIIFLSQQQIWADRKGAQIRLQRTDQQTLEGELIAVRDTQLILIDSTSQDQAIDLSEISTMFIKRDAHPLMGVLIGMVAGGVIGSALAPSKTPMAEMSKMGYGLIGILAGGVLGGAIGGALGSDSQIVVTKMSPAERARLLVKLRSKARVQNVT
jgi:hypothetical protein